jgi:hypothetical protein
MKKKKIGKSFEKKIKEKPFVHLFVIDQALSVLKRA